MRFLIWLGLFASIVAATVWYATRDECGRSGALSCPDVALEEGVGTTLDAHEECPGSGYLCAESRRFQVARWPLDKGRLKVRITLPDFVNKIAAEKIRRVAIEGIREWDGHPFPITIDTSEISLRSGDIGVLWTQGLFNSAIGLERADWKEDGKRIDYSVNAITIVIPPEMATENLMPGDLDGDFLSQMKAVTAHEMGHALGLRHSDSPYDIMYPTLNPNPALRTVSNRDILTVDTLYTLPNGAQIE